MAKLSKRETWLIGGIVVAALVAVIAIFARPAGPGSEQDASKPAAVQPAVTDAAGGSTQSNQNPSEQPPAGQQQQEGPTTIEELRRRDADDYTAIGDVDAPLVMIEYSDYRCPYCGLYATQTRPELIERYVETGQMRIEWRDTPIFGEQSFDAAVAARAAGEQGKFHEYNHAIFELAEEGGHTDLPRERLISVAEQVGVPDLEQFKADLESPDLLAAVQADHQEAYSIGVNSTPTFIIGEIAVQGAHPTENFIQAIDEQLAALDEG